MPGSSSQGVFLSYRREDAGPYARSLQLQLSQRFPDAQVFMDLDSIEAGLDFVEVIEEAVNSCAVLVALIGRQWATLTDGEGGRRLDNPDDFVRFEVKTALERGVRVIPVLIDGASPLRQQELPADLHKLARLNAHKLSYDRYQDDADRLFDLIQRVVAAAAEVAEADRKAREEADLKARQAEQRKGRQAEQRKARGEADRAARAEAEAHQRARAEADPKAREQARAVAERAESHRQSGRLDEALSDFNRAIELDPGNARAFNQRGVIHDTMGHAAEAFADYDRAAVLNPADAVILANRGSSYRQSGRRDKALADLNRAIELDPGIAWAFEWRALSFQELGNRDEALADFKRAFGLNPDLAHFDTGTSALKSKAPESAANLRYERRKELVEALQRQGYTSRAPYSSFNAKRNPDFRIKFTTTGVRFEVKNQQGRWLLAMTMLLTRNYLEALALIEGPPRTLLQAICATRAVDSRHMKWLQQRNADLQPERADR